MMRWARRFWIFSMFVTLVFQASINDCAAADRVTVFAAASTTNAMSAIGKLFMKKKLGEFVPSYASSSTLAKQIENGAPADIYISANEKWMDYLEAKKMIVSASRKDLLGNHIVLIAPKDSRLDHVRITSHFNLAGLLADGKLAMGDPSHVPAGIYGKAALENLGVWADVSKKVAGAKDVRAALVLVERAEVPLGIVYATDAAISSKVRIVGIFPDNSHPPIVYPVAAVAGRLSPVVERFFAFLQGPEAKAVFKRYGFVVGK